MSERRRPWLPVSKADWKTGDSKPKLPPLRGSDPKNGSIRHGLSGMPESHRRDIKQYSMYNTFAAPN